MDPRQLPSSLSCENGKGVPGAVVGARGEITALIDYTAYSQQHFGPS